VTLAESLLWPFTLPYGAIVRLRARAYRIGMLRPRRLGGFVISVGNLTTGGTGKTPMVLWIANKLVAERKSTGILTRGYGGRTTSAGSTSDEVQLLQSRLGDRVAFGVGGDRDACGRELEKRGVKWFVLDDGFQHQKLKRDVDIVMIDATNPFGGGLLLPAGRLREPRSALSRADIVVITRSERAPAIEAAVRRESDAPIFYARAQFDGLLPEPAAQYVTPAELAARRSRGEGGGPVLLHAQQSRLFVFCGIGNPSAFLADVRDWNYKIVGHKFFPDHHRYTARDMQAIDAEAIQSDATVLVCTEKDVFNLPHAPRGSLEIHYLRMKLRIDREDDFWRTILATAELRSNSARKPT
jgi:tetraacyldisaccharide 4'-kinase